MKALPAALLLLPFSAPAAGKADRMGSIEVGTCIETDGRKFIDGRQITQ